MQAASISIKLPFFGKQITYKLGKQPSMIKIHFVFHLFFAVILLELTKEIEGKP
jgi:hypothetical protein